MKTILLVLFLLTAFIIDAKAQSDTLLIKMRSGVVEKVAVSDLQKITFEISTSVDDLYSNNTNLTAKGNYPNPFVEKTTIEFEITKPGNVIINIYDNLGNHIQTLNCENCDAGKNTLEWNCFDKKGNRVQTGIYYYEVRFNEEIQSKKMILVK